MIMGMNVSEDDDEWNERELVNEDGDHTTI
jgi:hypothetical protein